ncbi:MAG: MBL fold metallo-hydrolase [Faecousia sp.]
MKKAKYSISIVATVLALVFILSSCTGEVPPVIEQDNPTSSPSIEQPVDIVPPASSDAPDYEDSSTEDDPAESTPPDETAPPIEEQPIVTIPPEDSFFEVHYIDVEQGDCSLIICDNHAMLIDGGEASESSKVYAYLKAHEVSHLDYIVATHAHSDHIGGLSGALNFATVGTAYCPVTSYDSKTFDSFAKYLGKQGVAITLPVAGEIFELGSASVQILGPQKNYDDPNDTSIVLKVTYGETSFIFTGDAERTSEADMLEAGYDLGATVLKVGHHGSNTSTSYPFLREVMPEYAVIQVGKDNSYGHPTEDTLSRLRDAGVKVYRNDLQGTIVCTSDGKTVEFVTDKNDTIQANPTETVSGTDIGIEYIGNKNSKKFHLPTCANLPAEKNRVFFDTRQEAVDAGFSPCGNCKP